MNKLYKMQHGKYVTTCPNLTLIENITNTELKKHFGFLTQNLTASEMTAPM